MKLTHAQIEFIEQFVEHNNANKAYALAGYKPDKSNAHKMVQKLSSEINSRLQARMTLTTGVCLNMLESIITDPEAHNRDKLNAISSWLDRSGIARASTQKLDVTQNETVPENRKVIRENQEMIMVGNGMLLPPLGENDATAFDTNDAETFEYLKQRQH
jgi:hypothetical protein